MYKKRVLDNGLSIIGYPIKNSQTTTLLVLVGVGSRYESEKERGLSHFLEHMMFKGTKKRPSAKIVATELDALGASYNAFTGYEYTGYWVKVRNVQKTIALDIISDIFQNSLLAEKDVLIERGAIVEELNMYLDLPMRSIHDKFQTLLYGDTPLGREIIGTKDHIMNFRKDDFDKYFNSKYVAGNTYIVVAGDVNSQTLDTVEEKFKHIRVNKVPKKESIKESQVEPKVFIDYKKTDQCHIMYGFRTIDIHSEEKYKAYLVSTILGGYMSSRLFTEIREKRGLAYYVRCSSDHFDDAGYLAVNAGIRNDKVLEAIKIISKEFTKIKTTGITDKELKIAKENIKAHMVMGLESSDNIAEAVAMHELQLKESFDVEKELAEFDKITKKDIQDFMNKYCLEDQLNLALIGNFKQKDQDNFLKLMKV